MLSFTTFEKDEFQNIKGVTANANEVLVVINYEYSNHKYTLEDFEDLNCIEVSSLTSAYNPSFEDESFRQIYKLTFKSCNLYDLNYIIEKLLQRDDIFSAEPNYIIENSVKEVTNDDISKTSKISQRSQFIPGNDYVSEQQYGFELCDFPLAWDIATDCYEVPVGIIDSGIDGYHEDLKYMVDWNNSKSFATGYGKENPLQDTTGHGTMVSSIIAAKDNNFLGFVGAAQNVKLVSIRAEASLINHYEASALAASINYASEIGLKLINYSIRGFEYSEAVKQAMMNFNGLIVASAGNDGINMDLKKVYPAAYNLDNVIIVGASDQNDSKWSDSNYSENYVDIFAPGVGIYCALPNDKYIYDSGTSYAVPYVTATAALIWGCKPNLTVEDLKTIICISVDKVDSLNGYCKYGGRLNARTAITTKL